MADKETIAAILAAGMLPTVDVSTDYARMSTEHVRHLRTVIPYQAMTLYQDVLSTLEYDEQRERRRLQQLEEREFARLDRATEKSRKRAAKTAKKGRVKKAVGNGKARRLTTATA